MKSWCHLWITNFDLFFIITANAVRANVNLVIHSSPMVPLNLIVLANVDFAIFAPSTQLLKNVTLSVRRELQHVPKHVTREKPFVWTASVNWIFCMKDKLPHFGPFVLFERAIKLKILHKLASCISNSTLLIEIWTGTKKI